jgi:hypothetical protein
MNFDSFLRLGNLLPLQHDFFFSNYNSFEVPRTKMPIYKLILIANWKMKIEK